jgi:S-adenosylmethionine:tRNA ribosyltransferase-isomerase
LVLHRNSGKIEHRDFDELLGYLKTGDVLVLNNSRVIPARLRGANAHSGGEFEILLLEENAANDWWVMLRPGKRARMGTQIVLRDTGGNPSAVRGTVIGKNEEGHRRMRFTNTPDIRKSLDELGEVPLPPYIHRPDARQMQMDRERYQTVFAGPAGSVAAPTAGLHFTEPLLQKIRSLGVQVCFLTLHVGLGTFAPVKTETLAAHTMHEERYDLPEETARLINEAKREGRRVIAGGTTTLRLLESVAESSPLASDEREVGGEGNRVCPCSSRTRVFIYPPFQFKIVDALLTNFHLPRSTLLMLASAFAAPGQTSGRELLLSAYIEAVRLRYRFFSYGDAMLIV